MYMESSSPEGPKPKVLSRLGEIRSRFVRNKTPKDSVSAPPAKEIDTDDPESRALRIENQRTLESGLEQTFGLPFTERLYVVRKALFSGLPHIRRHEATELRRTDLMRGPFSNFASSEFVRDRFMPQFAQLVDEMAEEIKNMDGDKIDAALNLASVIYTLGTPIHPYPDGNGQTLRLIALSYLHELAPDKFSQKYFPFKPIPGGHENTPATPILAVFTQLNGGRFSNSEGKKEFALRGGIVDDSRQRARGVTEEEMQEMFPDEAEKDRIRWLFEEGKALEGKLADELRGSHPTQTQVHLFLDYILNSQEGKKFITDFVLHPDQVPSGDQENIPRYLKSTLGILKSIGTEIEKLLESSDVHEQKFDGAKDLALKKVPE